MEEYSTKTAIELTGIYSSYISGLISEEDLCFEARALLNYTSFCIEQQERVDLGLPPKVVTSELIKTMFDFMKMDYTRFSGMDIDKGLYNEMDGLHLETERWVDTYIRFYKHMISESKPQVVDNSPQTLIIPDELDTEETRMYFTKAIKAGYMKVENDGYKWLFGGDKGQARLGYFCNKAFKTPRPINKLEEIFGVKKLSASITNADYEAKRVDVKMWREEMDNEIFND